VKVACRSGAVRQGGDFAFTKLRGKPKKKRRGGENTSIAVRRRADHVGSATPQEAQEVRPPVLIKHLERGVMANANPQHHPVGKK